MYQNNTIDYDCKELIDINVYRPYKPIDIYNNKSNQFGEAEQECAIARAFRENPGMTSILMVCYCKRCRPICL
jgi:hypothetical protein